jgi:hypothetical protein
MMVYLWKTDFGKHTKIVLNYTSRQKGAGSGEVGCTGHLTIEND